MPFWPYEDIPINGLPEAKPLEEPEKAEVSMSAPIVKPSSIETTFRQTILAQLYQLQGGTHSIVTLRDSIAPLNNSKSSVKKITKKKQQRKTVKEEKAKKNSRISQLVQELKNEEYRDEMVEAIAKALKTNGAVAEQYVDLFLRLNDDNLLELVTKSATIRKEVHNRVLEGLNKTLEKYND